MAYGDFKGLTRKKSSDKILSDKAFNIAKNPKYDGYQCELASMVNTFFDKKRLLCVQINLLIVVLKMRILQKKNWLKNYPNQLLENLKKVKYTHLL